MSIEDSDNLYVLEEEEKEVDTSPYNYASYGREEIEESVKEEEKKASAFGLLIRIMFNPVEGWKKLRRSGLSIEKLQSGCFYPLLSLLAISKFADYFYSVDVNLSKVVTESVVAFVSFFFGYFCIEKIMTLLLSKEPEEKVKEDFGKGYILISLSSLVIFSVITDLLPMIWPILIFLPIWTLYLMYKGVRFFLLPHKSEGKFYVVMGASAIGVPLLIEWILTTILPY
ncbi:MAG: hypothetical protein J1F12_00815 [Muribaculaceae bacterium]|nr:hypothetical protein [Muribaculaceae bacterium]